MTLSPDGRTATVSWLLHADEEPPVPPAYRGSIQVRAVGRTGHLRWVVVGAQTDGLALTDVRYARGRLGFSVTSNDRLESSLSFRVRVDGGWVPLGGLTLPQGAKPDPRFGELLTVEPGTPLRVEFGAAPGAHVDILVRHVGGTWLSLTHMAVDVPRP